MSERIYVTNKDKIEVNENNLVNLTLQDGRVFEKLEPRRLFPVSRIDEYITLLNADGIEIAVIRKLTDLDDTSREIIGYSLDDYYLIPHITKILSISEKNGKVRWIVETDRGYKEFDVRNRNHDVRVYSDGRVRVRDSDDNRYIISDYRALDAHSRRQAVADL